MTQDESQKRSSLLDHVVVGMNTVGSLWVLLLVLIINVDAFGRSFLSAPVAGVVEIVAISMALIVFCQLADTIRLGKLTRSDGYIEVWLRSGTRAGRLAVAGFEVLGAIFMGLVIIGTWPLLVRAFVGGHYIGTQGIFSFPEWPLKALVVAGAGAAGLCFVVRAWRILRGRRPEPASRVASEQHDIV